MRGSPAALLQVTRSTPLHPARRHGSPARARMGSGQPRNTPSDIVHKLNRRSTPRLPIPSSRGGSATWASPRSGAHRPISASSSRRNREVGEGREVCKHQTRIGCCLAHWRERVVATLGGHFTRDSYLRGNHAMVLWLSEPARRVVFSCV